jgi:glycosyltransferase involved in cell wall biosynthesis
MGPSARIRAFVAFAWKSARIAAKERADVVFATSTPLTIALPAIYAKWRRRIPMVFEVRDLWPDVPIALGILRNPILKIAAGQLERLAYRNAAQVIAASPGIAKGVTGSGYPVEHVTTIPNGCDFDQFEVDPELGHRFRSSHNWLRDRPLVVYAGTLGKVNGVGYLVRIAEHLLQMGPDIRFLIVGTGREEEEVRSLAWRSGVLNKNFFMLPQVSKHEIPMVLSAASITTSTVIDNPALWNNSANKFFDALAASRPIAINHDGWLAEIVRENDIGLVLSPRDHEDAARVLVGALHNGDWLKNAGLRASELGRSHFSRDDLATELLNVLEHVAKCPA